MNRVIRWILAILCYLFVIAIIVLAFYFSFEDDMAFFYFSLSINLITPCFLIIILGSSFISKKEKEK